MFKILKFITIFFNKIFFNQSINLRNQFQSLVQVQIVRYLKLTHQIQRLELILLHLHLLYKDRQV